ncbi:hypothetical protein FHG87_010052 [Trinorchestia longiramus]|nr:hypothetical protein FHG87_010052 [Trinorchestia longiramus]
MCLETNNNVRFKPSDKLRQCSHYDRWGLTELSELASATVVSYMAVHVLVIVVLGAFVPLQMLLTIGSLSLLSRAGVVNLPSYSLRAGWAFRWPSLFCALHGVLSLYALSGLNIPMYGALKRCTPLVNLVLSVVLLQKKFPSLLLTSSILFITAGCFIAALGDLTYDLYAYTMCVLSVMAQGLYQSLVQYHSEKAKMSSTHILQLNSYNTVGPTLLLSFVIGEPLKALQTPYWTDPWFLCVFTMIVVVGCLFNYALFLCTAVTSALTTSLVGVAKTTFQTAIGFFTFGGVRFHPLNVTGIFMNTLGGFLYAYVKYKEKNVSEEDLPKYTRDVNLNNVMPVQNSGVKTSLMNGVAPGTHQANQQLVEIKIS